MSESFTRTPSDGDVSEMDIFRQEIEAIKLAEESGELGSVHLRATELNDAVDVLELTDQDREIWNRLKDRQLTIEEYFDYKNNISPEERSRHVFAEFIANRLTSQVN